MEWGMAARPSPPDSSTFHITKPRGRWIRAGPPAPMLPADWTQAHPCARPPTHPGAREPERPPPRPLRTQEGGPENAGPPLFLFSPEWRKAARRTRPPPPRGRGPEGPPPKRSLGKVGGLSLLGDPRSVWPATPGIPLLLHSPLRYVYINPWYRPGNLDPTEYHVILRGAKSPGHAEYQGFISPLVLTNPQVFKTRGPNHTMRYLPVGSTTV